MEKQTKIISENFLTSNIFMFESFSCACVLEQLLSYPGQDSINTITICADKNSPVRFAYASKDGLVRLNGDGSVAEHNILGKLLAIEKDATDKYFSFFSKNGFLFPTALNKKESIGKVELHLIIDRLHATLELMSTITDMSRTSYEKIVRMIFYHLFSPIVQVETKDGHYQYVSSKHPYTVFLDDALNLGRDDRLNDTFNNSTFSFIDTITGITLDADFVDKTLNGNPPEEKYENSLFRKVFAAYCSPRNEMSKSKQIINDFLFHYLYEVGIVEQVDLDSTYYLKGKVNKKNFNDDIKRAALVVAKIIIKEEIECNLRRVRPTYDTTKLEPSWKIDSLLSALYFGLFYMRPTMETYRRCANSKCGEFFLVNVSSQKKKYCCTTCMNREMSARKRARDRIKETIDK